jgi:hypothetical protein
MFPNKSPTSPGKAYGNDKGFKHSIQKAFAWGPFVFLWHWGALEKNPGG